MVSNHEAINGGDIKKEADKLIDNSKVKGNLTPEQMKLMKKGPIRE